MGRFGVAVVGGVIVIVVLYYQQQSIQQSWGEKVTWIPTTVSRIYHESPDFLGSDLLSLAVTDST